MSEFKNLIVLGPLIYAIHHFEEHIIFNFREWRIKYFSDNNAIPTEVILIILSSLLLLFIFYEIPLVQTVSETFVQSLFIS